MLVSQDDQYALHLLPTIQGSLKQSNNLESVGTILKSNVTPSEPPYHQLSYQHTQPWIYRQESFTGVAAPGNEICKTSCSSYITKYRYSLNAIMLPYIGQIKDKTSTFCSKYWCLVTTTFVYYDRRLCTTGTLSKR